MAFMTPQEISDYLKIGYNQALEFVKHSGVPYTRIGNQYRVREEDLIAHLYPSQEKNISTANRTSKPIRNTLKKR